jgi:hypothetical protein
MGQLNFAVNGGLAAPNVFNFSNGTLYFFPVLLTDNLSLSIVNVLTDIAGVAGGTRTVSISIGIYSLTGSTLSLANSISGTRTGTVQGGNPSYISLTAISAGTNLSAGNWWFGIVYSSSGNNTARFRVFGSANAANAFPGSFIGGAMTATTNAPPSSVATSDLDIIGTEMIFQPVIILSA